MIEIVRLSEDHDRLEELLALIMSSFAYMNGVIDPPSSAHGLTTETLAEKIKAEIAFVTVENETLLGCVFCRPEPNSLYIGKLAVAPAAQGRGVGFALYQRAEETARKLGLTALRLETRVELVDNHRRFASWGFVRSAENAHPGFTRTTSIEMTKHLV